MTMPLLKAIQNINKDTIFKYFDQAATPSCSPGTSSLIVPIEGIAIEEKELFIIAQYFRQILLNEVPGWAITQVELKYIEQKSGTEKLVFPVLHEFAYMKGIVENVQEIIENLQKGIFRLPETEKKLSIDCEIFCDSPVSYPYKDFPLGDFFDEDQAEIVINPEQKIFTYQDTSHHVFFKFLIEKGKGYKTAQLIEREKTAEKHSNSSGILKISTGADFNPVKKVGYEIDNEKLTYVIQTNGAVSSLEAYDIAYRVFQNLLKKQEAAYE